MLRTLKWAYDLGVKQERERIAAYLRRRADGSRIAAESYDAAFINAKGKARKDKLARASAVELQIGLIINDILAPDWEQQMTSSIMFPDEGKKKGL